MAISVHCDVVSAEESIFSGEVEIGVFPGEAGELGILPHHTPLLTRIRPGTIRLKVQGQSDFEAGLRLRRHAGGSAGHDHRLGRHRDSRP
jgi:F0F1-type ATP synthase epsilon subunit